MKYKTYNTDIVGELSHDPEGSFGKTSEWHRTRDEHFGIKMRFTELSTYGNLNTHPGKQEAQCPTEPGLEFQRASRRAPPFIPFPSNTRH